MGKVPQQRRKLKSNVGRKSGLSKKSQKMNIPKRREMKASATIANAIVANSWDKHITMKKNFDKLGIVQNPNVRAQSKKNKKKSNKLVATSIVPELEAAVASHVATPRFAAAGEMRFVQELTDKHGEDYVAMARDHKLNVYQHTPKQIERKVHKVLGSLQLVQDHIDTKAAEDAAAESDNDDDETIEE
eukprot:m.257736 g.257736  ORF g.257736 m.257736 type:complete len:188 (-) comp35648_c0_seq1:143-706(-)